MLIGGKIVQFLYPDDHIHLAFQFLDESGHRGRDALGYLTLQAKSLLLLDLKTLPAQHQTHQQQWDDG